MNEVWKDIDGTNGYYQVSNMGNVRSLYEWDVNIRCFAEREMPKLLKGTITHNDDVQIDIKGKKVLFRNLVAAAFLPKPKNNENQIYHINGDKTDNRVENLAWQKRSHNGGKLSDKERKMEMMKDYQKGTALKDICKKYGGIRRDVIYYHLINNSIPRKRVFKDGVKTIKQPPLPKNIKKKVFNDYENAIFPSEIYSKYKINKNLFSSNQKSVNVTIRYVRKLRYTYLDFEYMFKRGVRNKDIQKLFGCSKNWVVIRKRQWNKGFFEHLKERQTEREKNFNGNKRVVWW